MSLDQGAIMLKVLLEILTLVKGHGQVIVLQLVEFIMEIIH